MRFNFKIFLLLELGMCRLALLILLMMRFMIFMVELHPEGCQRIHWRDYHAIWSWRKPRQHKLSVVRYVCRYYSFCEDLDVLIFISCLCSSCGVWVFPWSILNFFSNLPKKIDSNNYIGNLKDQWPVWYINTCFQFLNNISHKPARCAW